MFKELRLTCFRKHENRTLSFGPGLTIMRGANEGGKSSALEAISYALFGSRVLRDSVNNVVTWGHNPNDLKVELDVGDVTIIRSPRGAEIYRNGQVIVTGQTEATRWCESNVVGCDANTAMHLMFANQMSLRGVLESGPKATAQLLENLGDFGLFERLLNAASEQLALGSAAIQEARLRDLVSQREALQPALEPCPVSFKEEREILQAKLDTADKAQAEAQSSYDELVRESIRARAEQEAYEKLMGEQSHINSQLVALSARLKGLTYANMPAVETADMEDQLAKLADHKAVMAGFEKFCTLPECERSLRKDYDQHRAKVEQGAKAARDEAALCRIKLAELRTKLVVGNVCPTCGTNLKTSSEISARNEATQSEIESILAKLIEYEHAEGQCEAEIASLNSIADLDAGMARTVNSIGQWVTIDDTLIPSIYVWSGPAAESEVPDIEELKKALDAAKLTNQKIVEDTATLKVLAERQQEFYNRLVELDIELAGATPIPPVAVDALESAELHMLSAKAARLSAETAFLLHEQAYKQQLQDFQEYASKLENLTKQVSDTEAEIEQLAFNNLLVRKIRAARPIVGNKLWTLVLTSVSSIFSQMRGEKSVVTRTDEGFLINGKAATSFSGSTLDILGLAVRASLVKTFIPQCPMLVLDEAGAACDADRTAMMLGYIASSGFQQVILVTHEDVSESLSSNLIEL